MYELSSNDESSKISLPPSASKSNKRDLEALRISFKPASAENYVIPNVEITNFPDQYVLPDIGAEILQSPNLIFANLRRISDPDVKTFVSKLHDVVVNGIQVVGKDET